MFFVYLCLFFLLLSRSGQSQDEKNRNPEDGFWEGKKISERRSENKAVGNFGEDWTFKPGEDPIYGQKIIILFQKNQQSRREENDVVVEQLEQQNEVLGKTSFAFPYLVGKASKEKEKSASWNTYSPLPAEKEWYNRVGIEYHTAYGALLAAIEEYKGSHALIVIVAPILSGDSRMDEVPELVKKLIDAKLRLYLVNTSPRNLLASYKGDKPKQPSPQIMAIMSGGGIREVEVPAKEFKYRDMKLQPIR